MASLGLNIVHIFKILSGILFHTHGLWGRVTHSSSFDTFLSIVGPYSTNRFHDEHMNTEKYLTCTCTYVYLYLCTCSNLHCPMVTLHNLIAVIKG